MFPIGHNWCQYLVLSIISAIYTLLDPKIQAKIPFFYHFSLTNFSTYEPIFGPKKFVSRGTTYLNKINTHLNLHACFANRKEDIIWICFKKIYFLAKILLPEHTWKYGKFRTGHSPATKTFSRHLAWILPVTFRILISVQVSTYEKIIEERFQIIHLYIKNVAQWIKSKYLALYSMQ